MNQSNRKIINQQVIRDIAQEVMEYPSPIYAPGYENTYATGYSSYYGFLYRVMQKFDFKVALECGVWAGVATEHMILSNPYSFVIGIDVEFQREYRGVFRRHPKNVSFIHGNSTDPVTVEKVLRVLGGRTIDLLFLDSAHDGITTAKEIELYSPFLSEEALICCDDIYANDLMRSFWAGVKLDKFELSELHASQGFGIIIHKGEKQ